MSNIISIHGYLVHYIEGEPAIQDLDLAKRLGYVEPRMIRKLIKRMLENGQLKPEQVRSTVERYKNATEGETYYLGEFASLKVTTKSETVLHGMRLLHAIEDDVRRHRSSLTQLPDTSVKPTPRLQPPTT